MANSKSAILLIPVASPSIHTNPNQQRMRSPNLPQSKFSPKPSRAQLQVAQLKGCIAL
ncbi:hypothetical protein PCASD_02706 [Puccinia coronata f. sp. avenae]|uniref:Uncharacterized protein n=1 Tax=Puccinia coronata f. sp. avenae TaxID=200324 RepID=A0A2N5VH80_9BASI|nr:hypothetical protein PCASD_02706 [Puccinia coronata f. sp. avenae]